MQQLRRAAVVYVAVVTAAAVAALVAAVIEVTENPDHLWVVAIDQQSQQGDA